MTHVPFQRQAAAALGDLEWNYLFDAIPANAAGAHLYYLEYGVGVETPSRKTASALWKEYGDIVLEWWCVERPGTRPSCWWKYSAKEPRRRLGGTGDSYSDNYRKFGVPCCWHTETIGPLDDLPLFESQAAYLSRLGLFLPGEKERLTAEDFQPEPLDRVSRQWAAPLWDRADVAAAR